MEKEMQDKVNQLSMMEQNLQNFSMQKQQLQSQIMEVESAEKEIGDSGEAYKIIGNIMVATQKDNLAEELKEKKERLQKRIDAFEKQESKIKKKAEDLQQEVLSEMKKSEKSD